MSQPWYFIDCDYERLCVICLPPPRHHQGHVPVLGPAGSAGHLPQQQLLRTPDAAAAEQQGD